MASIRLADRSTHDVPLSALSADLVLSAVPWREIRSHRGQRHFPGLYWSSTTGGHVVYESRLELARLLLADADPDVVGIAAQPFLVRDDERRHVPDFLLARADRSVLVVNVKPADRLEKPGVARALSWAADVFVARGWEHEVWSGADRQLLANMRFLAGYKQSRLFDAAALAAAASAARAAETIAEAEAAVRACGFREPRPVVLHLLWSGILRMDLTRPLTSETALEMN
ncbi:MAG TPA: TnsA-like heteromeric transposase endonuclease subunit [Solirubrobacteraceae bacterium]